MAQTPEGREASQKRPLGGSMHQGRGRPDGPSAGEGDPQRLIIACDAAFLG